MASNNSSPSKKNLFIGIAVAIVVAILLFFVFGGSSDDSSSGSEGSSGNTYSVASESGEVTGEILVRSENSGDSGGTIAYVYVINDDLQNNGKCIDAGEPFCTGDSREGLNNAESIKYHYALVIDGVVGSDGEAIGTYLEPVYCNQDALLADPMSASNVGENSSNALDVRCGQGYDYNTWSPTSVFVARNGSSVQSLENVLSSTTLRLYDTSNLYKINYTTADGSGTAEQIVPSLEESISNGTLLKTYTVTAE